MIIYYFKLFLIKVTLSCGKKIPQLITLQTESFSAIKHRMKNKILTRIRTTSTAISNILLYVPI